MVIYSVDSIRETKFRRHGKVNLKVIDEHLFWYECEGPFNEELISSVVKMLAPLISKKHDLKEVIVLNSSCMATQQMLSSLTDYLSVRKSQGNAPVAVAIVVEEGVEGRNLMRTVYQQCYESLSIPFKYCASEAQAVEFISQF